MLGAGGLGAGGLGGGGVQSLNLYPIIIRASDTSVVVCLFFHNDPGVQMRRVRQQNCIISYRCNSAKVKITFCDFLAVDLKLAVLSWGHCGVSICKTMAPFLCRDIPPIEAHVAHYKTVLQ